MIDERKLTDWFPPNVLPARPGWYQREYTAGEVSWMNSDPDYWDGEYWYYGDGEGGYDPRPEAGPPNLRWRGLAEPPLTDWFDPGTQPVHEGVYEIESSSNLRWFAHWMPNNSWGYTYSNDCIPVQKAINFAAGSKGTFGVSARGRRWRGLAIQP